MATAMRRAGEYPEPVVAWWSGRRLRFALVLLLLAASYSASWHLAKVDPGRLLTGLPKMAGWAAKAWPPATDELPVLLLRTAETIAMAAIGTTAAALLALPLCVVAARNVTPSMALYYPARWFLNGYGLVAYTEGLTKRYAPAVTALAEVSFAVRPGEFVAVLGPSGAGKTTLFRCLTGLTRPDRGTVMVAGRDIWQSPRELRLARRELALIFQQFNLIRRLSALENVLVGRLAHVPAWRVILRSFTRADRQLALGCLDTVGLLDRAGTRADELSGGQQQRVAIARALAQHAKVILADEPVASLDPESSATVLESLRSAVSTGVAVVASLHQVHLARAYADRIVALRDGRIVEDAPASRLDASTIEQIYERTGERNES